MIVLKENEWAEGMIRNSELGKKPSKTLTRVARYYLDKGYKKEDVRNKLDLFLLRCDPSASLTKWANAVDYALNKAIKYEAIHIDRVNITSPEMGKIEALKGRQIKRLAFTLLCLARYWNIVIPKGDFWVNTKDSEIMAMANINTSIKRQSMMYKVLEETGLIQFSKKVDNTNVRVLFAEDGETAVSITDFRNLGYQYLKLQGEPYMECKNCGITTKIRNPVKGNRQKYCALCAMEVATQQRVNSVMRHRKSKNN